MTDWIDYNKEHIIIGTMFVIFCISTFVFLHNLYELNDALPVIPEYNGGYIETLPDRIPDALRVMNYDNGRPWYFLFGAGIFQGISVLIGWISWKIAHGVDFENYLAITLAIIVLAMIVLDSFIGTAIDNPIFRSAIVVIVALILGIITLGAVSSN